MCDRRTATSVQRVLEAPDQEWLDQEWPDHEWMLSGVILAIYQPRRRIDQLLSRLTPPRRSSVEAAVAALLEGSLDAATLVTHVRDGARVGEGRMQQLVNLLAPDRLGDGSVR